MPARKQPLSLSETTRGLVQKLRNPLNALLLNLDTLDDDIAELKIQDKKDIPERLERIRKAIAELDSLLSEVLRLTDLPRPQITAVNVNALAREVETFSKPESSKKEVAVRLKLQESLPKIQADPGQIKQAMLSIFLNAIEACPLKGSMTLVTEADGHQVRIRVIDNGPGIPPELQGRIFEPFFSTKEAGAGLGLPLALEIVKRHQGEISFVSEVGKGTTFVVSLPGSVDGR